MTSLVRQSDSGHLEHLMATVSTYVAHENKGGTCIECFEFEVVKVVPFANPTNQTAGNAFRIDVGVQTLNNIACGVANLPYKLRNETFCPAHTLKGKFAPYFISHPLCQCDMSLGPDTLYNGNYSPEPAFPPSRSISHNVPSKSGCSMQTRLRILFLTLSGTPQLLIFL
jgi:hypothetical protein